MVTYADRVADHIAGSLGRPLLVTLAQEVGPAVPDGWPVPATPAEEQQSAKGLRIFHELAKRQGRVLVVMGSGPP